MILKKAVILVDTSTHTGEIILYNKRCPPKHNELMFYVETSGEVDCSLFNEEADIR